MENFYVYIGIYQFLFHTRQYFKSFNLSIGFFVQIFFVNNSLFAMIHFYILFICIFMLFTLYLNFIFIPSLIIFFCFDFVSFSSDLHMIFTIRIFFSSLFDFLVLSASRSPISLWDNGKMTSLRMCHTLYNTHIPRWIQLFVIRDVCFRETMLMVI